MKQRDRWLRRPLGASKRAALSLRPRFQTAKSRNKDTRPSLRQPAQTTSRAYPGREGHKSHGQMVCQLHFIQGLTMDPVI